MVASTLLAVIAWGNACFFSEELREMAGIAGELTICNY
jgi:hypothetical protein